MFHVSAASVGVPVALLFTMFDVAVRNTHLLFFFARQLLHNECTLPPFLLLSAVGRLRLIFERASFLSVFASSALLVTVPEDTRHRVVIRVFIATIFLIDHAAAISDHHGQS
jgi:hypothetical protein